MGDSALLTALGDGDLEFNPERDNAGVAGDLAGVFTLGDGLLDFGDLAFCTDFGVSVLAFGETLLDFLPDFGVDRVLSSSEEATGVLTFGDRLGVLAFGEVLLDRLPDLGVAMGS
jgi:hypothetical protein